MRGWLTTEEVMSRSGKSRAALFSWVRRHYISGPIVQKVPAGRGRRALWAEGVIREIEALDQLSAQGLPLEKAKQQIWIQGAQNSQTHHDYIAEMARAWQAAGSAGNLPQRLGLEPANASLGDCFVFAIGRLARLAGLDSAALERVEWIAYEHLVPALLNFVMGHDPVLVVVPDGTFIAPKLALGALYDQSQPDEWVDLVAKSYASPPPYAQRPGRKWFPVFTVLDLGPVMRTLWQQWGKPVGAAFGNRELQYEYAPVVWHREGDRYFESDAVLESWGRSPFAMVLDIAPMSTRQVGPSHPYLKMREIEERRKNANAPNGGNRGGVRTGDSVDVDGDNVKNNTPRRTRARSRR